MDSSQSGRTQLNNRLPPHPGSALPHLGTYVREMAVSVARMYENALDWEHLPHLHSGSFSRIELLALEPFAWRARVWNPAPRNEESSVIELRLDPTCRRWITRTLEGANTGSEIWTHCIPMSATGAAPANDDRRLLVVVDFYAPAVATGQRARVGAAYAALYERLYDEDERMMLERQAALDARTAATYTSATSRATPQLADLGPRAALLARLPIDIVHEGRRLRVVQIEDGLHAYALDCPHALAPLDDVPIVDGELTCPWHGLRFDVRSGACVAATPGGTACRLPLHRVHIDADGTARLD